MAEKASAGKTESVNLEKSLTGLGQKVHQAKATRPGTIVFHASGSGGGSFGLDTGQGQTRVIKFAETIREKPPLIEFIGDAATLQAIIDGQKNAFRTFLGGGVRIRGDLRYFGQLAFELGYIDKPL